jgi:hypothetical protein
MAVDMARVRLRRRDFYLGLYEPIDADCIPDPITDQGVASTIAEAREFAREYNEMAELRPNLTRLMGLFAIAAYPQVRPYVRIRKTDVKAQRGA